MIHQKSFVCLQMQPANYLSFDESYFWCFRKYLERLKLKFNQFYFSTKQPTMKDVLLCKFVRFNCSAFKKNLGRTLMNLTSIPIQSWLINVRQGYEKSLNLLKNSWKLISSRHHVCFISSFSRLWLESDFNIFLFCNKTACIKNGNLEN